MAGVAEDVEMGVCTVMFGTEDLGYTAGGVKCSYKADSVEIMVDQEDAPIDEKVVKQTFQVTVPLAEANLERLALMMPGATYTETATTGAKKRLVLSGASGASLASLAKKLILKPVAGGANDWVTLMKACPIPEIEFSYEKDKVRVYEVTFKALKDATGFVVFGDETTV